MGSRGGYCVKSPSLQQDLLAAAVEAMPKNELSAVRSAALADFANTGFPTTRDEDWRYTSLAGAAKASNEWLRGAAAADYSSKVAAADDAAAIAEVTANIDAHWLIVRNGVVDSESLQSLRAEISNDVRISSQAEGLGTTTIVTEDALSAFNAALLLDVLQISAQKNARTDKPIGILFVQDTASELSQVRIIIDAQENSCLQVITCTVSAADDAHFSNAVTQITLADGAQLDMIQIQQRGAEQIGITRVTAQLQRNATFNHGTFDFGGSLTRNDIVVDIAGPGATTQLNGLYLAAGKQHMDNHIQVNHAVGPAHSSQNYRGILTGRSRCVFNGKAVVLAGADGTDASQANHNLLLSPHAEIDTKPELEIYADDVKCNHGATVGQLDEAALFYLRTRGIAEGAAKQMLTHAFAAGMLSLITIDECHDYIARALDKRLNVLICESPST